MKYTIISINDDRKAYKDNIRKHVGLEEFKLQAFDANKIDPLRGIASRGLELSPKWTNPKKGELGVWLSNYEVWGAVRGFQETLVAFEDDAVIDKWFKRRLDRLISELPLDWDFAALWVPENQRIDYRYSLFYEQGIPRIQGILPDHIPSSFDYGAEHTCLAYQGYGMVSLVYSPKGGAKLEQLAHEYGITGPVDCWIFEQAHMGNVKGYAPKPDYANIVTYDWAAESHVQLTERVK